MGRHGDLKNRKSLRYAGLHHSTLRAYRRALKAILAYANKSSVKMFRSSQLDVSVSSYLDHCYQEGEPLSYAGHLLSALKRFHPSLKFKLPESSQFYKNWTKTYHPTRAIPASWEFTEGLMGYALCHRQENLGLLIGLGFIGMLRTAEMLALTFQHLVVHRDQDTVSMVIPTSKTSSGNPQVIQVSDRQMVSMILRLRGNRPKRLLWPKSGQAFRKAFHQLVVGLLFTSHTYVPYALRRGGATYHFQTYRNLDLTVQQGRWACPKTARQYLDSGTCQLAHVHWSRAQTKRVLKYRLKGRDWRLRQENGKLER